MKKHLVIISLMISTILLTTSCTYKRGTNPAAINDANAALTGGGGAHASGIGEETRFGDQAGGGMVAARHGKRVYYFDFDSNIVHEEDKVALGGNASYLRSHPNISVLLEGHTDPRGSREYNIGLGERRAKAVANVLIANGINPGQIRVVSYGAEKLASPGHSEAAYQLDRRVVLVYLRR